MYFKPVFLELRALLVPEQDVDPLSPGLKKRLDLSHDDL